jgi:hypothetical protein
MKPAFIIGNGTSRKDVDLNALKTHGTIFGCNALYRTFEPDWLIAFDDKIVDEIKKSNFPKDKLIVPPEKHRYEPKSFNPNQPRQNAGMVAMFEAIKKGHEQLYSFGMDFVIEDYDYNISNIFDGTNAYGSETRCSVSDSYKRCEFMNWFALQNPSVTFFFVFPREAPKFRNIFTAKNIVGKYMDNFWKEMSND